MGLKAHIVDYKKLYIIILIVVGSLGVITGGYYFYRYFKQSSIDPLSVIPQNAAVIIDINSPEESIEQLLNNNNIWSHLLSVDSSNTINNQLIFLDSMVLGEENFQEILSNNRTCISLHYVGQDKLALLFAISIETQRNKKQVVSFIEQHIGEKEIEEKNYEGVDFFAIRVDGMSNKLFYAIYKGVFIASYNELLLQDAILQAKSGESVEQNPYFIKLQKTAGQNVEANVYVNINYLGRTFATAFKEVYRNDFAEIEKMAKWLEMDLVLKENEIILNGFVLLDKENKSYLHVLQSQEAQLIEVQDVVPADVAAMLVWGVSNHQEYFKTWNEIKSKDQNYLDIINEFKNRYGTEVIEDFTSWVDNQYALIVLSDDTVDLYAQSFAIFKSKDEETAMIRLKSYQKEKEEVMDFRGFNIYNLSTTGIMPVLYGSVFQNIEEAYCVSIAGYVVFGNSVTSLKRFINNYLAGKTLGKTDAYQSLSDNLSERSNFFAYLNTKNSFELMNFFVREKYHSYFEGNTGLYKNFEAVIFQLTSDQDMFYANFYLTYSPGERDETDYVWETVLDAEIITPPYLIWDHQTSDYAVIVFDKHNYMYLINISGEVLWKIPLAESPISKVHYVDCYQNGKYQYLFNTPNYIYLIDKNGKKVDGFPVKLNETATSPMALFDYENNKSYRILVACADNQIYNYAIDGLPTTGWELIETKEFVRWSPVHIRLKSKDYIIVAESDGSTRFYNRRGEKLNLLEGAFVNAPQTAFFSDEKTKEFVTTDEDGAIIRISTEGKIEKKIIEELSPDHSFIYYDIDNDGEKDYILYDQKQLFIYDKNGDAILKHGFSQEMENELNFIKGPDSRAIVSLNSTKGELFLFDKGGLIKTDISFHSEKPASFYTRDNSLNVFTVFENKVYYYMIGE